MQSFHAGTAQARYRPSALTGTLESIRARSAQFYLQVKFLGHSHTMDDYEQRKLRIFNQINFFQVLVGFLVPVLGILLPGKIPVSVWSIACWPAAVNIFVLSLNYFHKNTAALLTYFILYPFCTCLVYLNGL